MAKKAYIGIPAPGYSNTCPYCGYVGLIDEGYTSCPVCGEAVSQTEVSLARKVKKMYLGIDGVSRKIKKAYIGIGGVARPCFSGGELAYYGTITPLSTARFDLAFAKNNNCLIFVGGNISGTNGTPSEAVDAYNKSLVKISTSNLTYPRTLMAGTKIGSRALFGGGSNNGSDTRTEVYSFNDSLTLENAASPFSYARKYSAANSIGDYALFAGGVSGDSSLSSVESYDSALTKTTASTPRLSTNKDALASVVNFGRVLFAGGDNMNTGLKADVDVYDKSLTKTTATSLSVARGALGGAYVGNYILFAGGGYRGETDNESRRTEVDVYNSSLTRSSISGLSKGRSHLASASTEGYALFGGGLYSPRSTLDDVDVYDKSLTHMVAQSLNAKRCGLAGDTIGDYALFAGGKGGGNVGAGFQTTYSTVDAYIVI